MQELLPSVPRRTLLWVGLAAAIGVGIAVWHIQGNASASSSALLPTVKVTRADLVVSVGGVGRIVEKNGAAQITIPSASSAPAAGATTTTSSTSTAPGNAVFPRASGHVARILVEPGQHVRAGQRIAVLDDGGVAAAALAAAESDRDSAAVELEQKLTQDPLRGFPATPAELAAARLAVTSAHAKLAQLRRGARPGDIATARADVQKAKGDLETLVTTPGAHARAVEVAREAIKAAKVKLARLQKPATPTDITAAQSDLAKARADLAKATADRTKATADRTKAIADKAALLRPPVPPTPAAIDAATQAVNLAQQRLDRLTGPPDPIALQQALTDEMTAIAAHAELEAQKPPPLTATLEAADAAIQTASLKVQKLRGPPDPVDVQAAQSDLAKAKADLAALQQPPVPATPEAIDAADKAIDAANQAIYAANPAIHAANEVVVAARTKLRRLTKPNPADVESARLDLAKARADYRTLTAGPGPQALGSAREAVAASRARLAQLLAPPLPSDIAAAKADIGKTEGDLAALEARRAPASPFDIRLARLKVSAADQRIEVARLAEQELTVRATTSGTVTSVLTDVGAPVDGSTPVATVSDLGNLAAMVNLSEFDAAQVKRGQQARVSVDALGGKVFLGKVLFASLTGSDNGSGVVTFPVLIGLNSLSGAVKPGMNASVRIIVAQRQHVLEVPLEAVTKNDEDRPVVTVMDAQGRTSLKPVKLGIANNKSVEILKGVHAGQRLVIESSSQEGD
jgi:multidrug efflux pump subunit AcrA (membrane-fusion protein)